MAGSVYDVLNGARQVARMVEDLLKEPRIKAWQIELRREELLAESLPGNFASVMRRVHEVFARAHGTRIWGTRVPGRWLRGTSCPLGTTPSPSADESEPREGDRVLLMAPSP